MSERRAKPKPNLETQTAERLTAAQPVVLSKDESVNKLLSALLDLALNGNTAAAKIYLDFCQRQAGEDSSAIGPDEVYKLLQEFASK